MIYRFHFTNSILPYCYKGDQGLLFYYSIGFNQTINLILHIIHLILKKCAINLLVHLYCLIMLKP